MHGMRNSALHPSLRGNKIRTVHRIAQLLPLASSSQILGQDWSGCDVFWIQLHDLHECSSLQFRKRASFVPILHDEPEESSHPNLFCFDARTGARVESVSGQVLMTVAEQRSLLSQVCAIALTWRF